LEGGVGNVKPLGLVVPYIELALGLPLRLELLTVRRTSCHIIQHVLGIFERIKVPKDFGAGRES